MPRRIVGAMVVVAVIGALFAARPEPAQATPRTFYLATSGSDGSGTGSLERPWRTFMHARSFLLAGDTLVVRGGLYVEQVQYNFTLGGRLDPKQGTATAPIRVVAYPGERPIIKGILVVNGARYWTFDGINVTWNALDRRNNRETFLVRFNNGVGWQFLRGEVWGSRSYGAFRIAGDIAGQPANWKVAENCIHDAYGANARNLDHTMYIDTGVRAGAGVIERNLVFNAHNGALIKFGPSGSTGGSANIGLHFNTLYNGAHNVMVARDTHHIYATRNIVGRARGEGWYPNFRGYYARGAGNVARDNLGFAAGALITNTDGRGWADGRFNRFGIDPRFNLRRLNCDGFQPTNPAAARWGRYAPR